MADEQHSAALIALHADVISPKDAAEATDLGDGVAPTRTTAQIRHPLEAETVIGRDPNAQIRINEQRTDVSRRHAIIRREDGRYMLYDQSTHGTFVNGRRVNGMCRLDHQDVIGLANTREMLSFVDESRPEQASVALTDREREILVLLAAGRRIKEIADALVISQNTVNSHLKNLYEKLDASSKAEAINQARKLGLI